MPRGDGTGSMGMGPMTGRGAGYCAGYGVPGFLNPGFGGGGRGFGRGMGRGRGRGRGAAWRHGGLGAGYAPYPMMPVAPAPMTARDEAELLRGQAEGIRRRLEEINARLGQLERDQSPGEGQGAPGPRAVGGEMHTDHRRKEV
jgi:hypothetical protein